MRDGLFVGRFGAAGDPNARNGAIVVLVGGKIYGGDSGFFYTGTYQVVAESILADADVVKYGDIPSVFPGNELEYKVILSGTIGDDGVIDGTMERNDMRGLKIPMRLERKRDV